MHCRWAPPSFDSENLTNSSRYLAIETVLHRINWYRKLHTGFQLIRTLFRLIEFGGFGDQLRQNGMLDPYYLPEESSFRQHIIYVRGSSFLSYFSKLAQTHLLGRATRWSAMISFLSIHQSMSLITLHTEPHHCQARQRVIHDCAAISTTAELSLLYGIISTLIRFRGIPYSVSFPLLSLVVWKALLVSLLRAVPTNGYKTQCE